MLGAGTQMQHGHNLGARIDGQPQPEDLCGAAEPGSNFVQLQVRDVQVAEAVLMEDFCVPACTREPPRNRGLLKAENPHSRRRIQSFGQRREDHCDLVRWGFQTIEWSVASSAECGAALLTAKGLDALGLAMLAIANQRVDARVSVPEVLALLIGTGKNLRPRSAWELPKTIEIRKTTRSRNESLRQGACKWAYHLRS